MKSEYKVTIITIIITLVVFIVFMWWHSKGRKRWEIFKQDRINAKPNDWSHVSPEDIKKIVADKTTKSKGGKRTTRKTKTKQKNKK